MAREDLHFRLRIPEELKQRIQSAADYNRRSMTAEIIARLDVTFEKAGADLNPIGMLALIQRLEAAVDLSGDVARELHAELSLIGGSTNEEDASIMGALNRFAEATEVNKSRAVRQILRDWLDSQGYLKG